LFLQGGASLQFSMVPMNFLSLFDAKRDYTSPVVGEEGSKGSAEFGDRDIAANRLTVIYARAKSG